MILTYQRIKEQHQRRLNLKTAEEAFCRQIVGGTNCSAYEAEIIVDKAKQHFGIGEYAEERTLLDGQMVFVAVSENAPSGMPMEECPRIRVVLTHLRRAEDQEVASTHGASAKRQQQLMRMCEEAREQGALLSQEDLGIILDCEMYAPSVETLDSFMPEVLLCRLEVPYGISVQESVTRDRRCNCGCRAGRRQR